MMYFQLILISLFVGLNYANNSTTAKDVIGRVSKCHISEKKELKECFSNYWRDLRPFLYSGIPELDVPELDPIFIEKLNFPEDSAIIQGKAFISNLTVHGLANYTMRGVDVDLSKLTLTAELSLPQLLAEGDFFFDGSVVLLPIKSIGDVTIKFTDVNATLVNFLERGVKNVQLVKSEIRFMAKDIDFNVVNLLNNEEVAEAINKLINDNGQEIFEELKPEVNAKLGKVIANHLRGVIKELPSDIFQMS